ESANTDNTHALCWLHATLHNWIEHRDAAAEQRAGFDGINSRWQRTCPNPVATHPVREPAVTTDHGLLRGGAKIVIAGQALRARHATARIPAQSHPVAQLHPFHLTAGGDNRPHHFV